MPRKKVTPIPSDQAATMPVAPVEPVHTMPAAPMMPPQNILPNPSQPFAPGVMGHGMNPQQPMMPNMPMLGNMQPGMMPAATPGMMPGVPTHMAQAAPYPMNLVTQMQMQMMQMMQMMQNQIGLPGMDSAAQPFRQPELSEEVDPGLDADIIRPQHLRSVIKQQQALPVQEVLDCLCLTEDSKYALGGIPKGCTIAFIGPPGKGKTRTAIAALCKAAYDGVRCAFVVAEEGFLDERNSGRDDLCSRLTKIGMKVLGITEAQFQKKVAPNIAVIQSQYHKGHTWDSFVTRYRFVIEKDGIQLVIIDSLNTLDPSKTRTADNLSALKTYNHEKGVTCLTIGQIKDTGVPVGGEALVHTADVVFFLEEIGLQSKEIAEQWGAKYRDRITVIRALKSVTTPVFPNPIRVISDESTGVLKVHPEQPAMNRPLPPCPTEPPKT